MTFDKSKVCIAGLHDIPVGTKGYCANTIALLENYVTTENKQAVGVLYDAGDGYYFAKRKDYNFDCTMFYPLPEKKYRPYKTIEEASGIIGKVIRHKLLHRILLITSIEYSDSVKGSECILINGERADKIFKNYTFEDGTPVGVEV